MSIVPLLSTCTTVMGTRRVFGTEDPRFLTAKTGLCRYCPEEGDLFFVCGDTEYESFVYHKQQWYPFGLRGSLSSGSLLESPTQKACTKFRMGGRHFVNLASDPNSVANSCKLYPKNGDIYLGGASDATFLYVYFDGVEEGAAWYEWTLNTTFETACVPGPIVSERTIVGPIVDTSARCEKIVGAPYDLFIVSEAPIEDPQAYYVNTCSANFYKTSGAADRTPIVLSESD